MSLHYLFLLLSSVYLIPHYSAAEVVLDGTLGHSGALPGPDFKITEAEGQQWGENLFQSFREFNLQVGESATFSGPDSVKNVISRVTGGTRSIIEGTLRSTMPNADMYFLNPAGIWFGEKARLDVKGAFHASTADTLRLGSDGQFNAAQPALSLLSVAPPSAFGFLTNTPAAIQVKDSKLSVSEAKTLSLVGGDLNLQGSFAAPAGVKLSAKFGQINLVSVASSGEVIPTSQGLDLSMGTRGGTLVANKTTIGTAFTGSSQGNNDVSSGDIFIRAERLELTDSLVWGSRNEHRAGLIDIQAKDLTLQTSSINMTANEADTSGIIRIQADQLRLLTGAKIINRSAVIQGMGDGGLIELNIADTLTMSGGSEIWNSSLGGRHAGDIRIEARRINLTEGATILSQPFNTGDGGAMVFKVTDELNLSNGSGIIGGVWSQEASDHNATNIQIETGRLVLDDKSFILNGTFGGRNAGAIKITVGDRLTLSNSVIFSGGQTDRTDLEKIGNSGDIEITADNLTLQQGALISCTNEKGGQAGKLEIQVRQLLLKEGASIESATNGSGQGGPITIKVADTLTVAGDTDSFTAIRSNSSALTEAGNAGEINIQANTIKITKNGGLSTSAKNAAGGNITLTTPFLLYVQQGKIYTEVKGGEGDGGNITLQQPIFVILDGAELITKAKRGFGGNITIDSKQFLAPADSKNVLDASSDIIERSGKIVITAPTNDLKGTLIILPSKIGAELPLQCSRRPVGKMSDLVIKAMQSLSAPPPEALKTSP